MIYGLTCLLLGAALMRPYLDRPAGCLFDERRAERAVQFFNDYLRHTKGRWAGQPFNLRPWQEIHIREIFGRVDADGNRVVRQVFWCVPKKNGKSEAAAGIALKLLLADDEPGAEVYGVAADRDQAGLVYSIAAAMVRHDSRLKKSCKIIESVKRIVVPADRSFYRAVSAEKIGKSGYNSHGVIFDEVHEQEDDRLWNVLTVGAGDARSQPLVFAITTAGIPGESPVAEMLYDQARSVLRGTMPCPDWFYPVVYQAPEDARWDDEEVWRACNPAYGDFLSARSIRQAADSARLRPQEMNSFLRFRLNLWVKQQERVIPMDDWMACGAAVPVADFGLVNWYGGLDLATKQDFVSFTLVALDGSGTLNYLPYFWLPAEAIEKLARSDAVAADNVRRWAKAGHITITDGNAVDFRVIQKRIIEIHQATHFRMLYFDPMFAHQMAQELDAAGVPVMEIGQSYKYLSEPTNAFLDAIAARKIRHGGNPVLTWMADCFSTAQNVDGAIRPAKPDRKKSSKRIDGIAAAIMATFGVLRNDARPSVYESRELRVI